LKTADLHRPRPSLLAWRDNPRQKQTRKYANEPTEIDGVKFDSRAEAKRWCDLQILQRTGHIRDLQRQVRYVLVPRQIRPSGGVEREKAYVADFVYTDGRTGRTVVEDVKGAEPAIWGWKRALMLHVHGIEVQVVRS
jgi:hypothetical protein